MGSALMDAVLERRLYGSLGGWTAPVGEPSGLTFASVHQPCQIVAHPSAEIPLYDFSIESDRAYHKPDGPTIDNPKQLLSRTAFIEDSFIAKQFHGLEGVVLCALPVRYRKRNLIRSRTRHGMTPLNDSVLRTDDCDAAVVESGDLIGDESTQYVHGDCDFTAVVNDDECTQLMTQELEPNTLPNLDADGFNEFVDCDVFESPNLSREGISTGTHRAVNISADSDDTQNVNDVYRSSTGTYRHAYNKFCWKTLKRVCSFLELTPSCRSVPVMSALAPLRAKVACTSKFGTSRLCEVPNLDGQTSVLVLLGSSATGRLLGRQVCIGPTAKVSMGNRRVMPVRNGNNSEGGSCNNTVTMSGTSSSAAVDGSCSEDGIVTSMMGAALDDGFVQIGCTDATVDTGQTSKSVMALRLRDCLPNYIRDLLSNPSLVTDQLNAVPVTAREDNFGILRNEARSPWYLDYRRLRVARQTSPKTQIANASSASGYSSANRNVPENKSSTDSSIIPPVQYTYHELVQPNCDDLNCIETGKDIALSKWASTEKTNALKDFRSRQRRLFVPKSLEREFGAASILVSLLSDDGGGDASSTNHDNPLTRTRSGKPLPVCNNYHPSTHHLDSFTRSGYPALLPKSQISTGDTGTGILMLPLLEEKTALIDGNGSTQATVVTEQQETSRHTSAQLNDASRDEDLLMARLRAELHRSSTLSVSSAKDRVGATDYSANLESYTANDTTRTETLNVYGGDTIGTKVGGMSSSTTVGDRGKRLILHPVTGSAIDGNLLWRLVPDMCVVDKANALQSSNANNALLDAGVYTNKYGPSTTASAAASCRVGVGLTSEELATAGQRLLQSFDNYCIVPSSSMAEGVLPVDIGGDDSMNSKYSESSQHRERQMCYNGSAIESSCPTDHTGVQNSNGTQNVELQSSSCRWELGEDTCVLRSSEEFDRTLTGVEISLPLLKHLSSLWEVKK
eukprot:Lankesteria_metandrocarpae@DN4987_c0_g1_i1.p1